MDRPLQAEHETMRLPLYAEEDITSSGTYLSPFGQGQQFINCIPQVEVNPVTKETQTIVQKRSGIKCNADMTTLLTAFFGSGVYVPRDHIVVTQLQDVNVIAAFDPATNKIFILSYQVTGASINKVGELSGCTAADFVFLSEGNIAGRPHLFVSYTKYDKSTSGGYYSAGTAGSNFGVASLVEITDTDFPPKKATPEHITGPFVQMNQTTYIMTIGGYIYNSDQNSIASWDAKGNIPVYAYPDRGVGLIRYKNHIVAFSEDSIEFFNDIGNPFPKSPLQRTDQAFIKFGCIDPKCMINIDDTLYWIAASSKGTDGLWKLEGYTPVKVSNAKQDLLISGAFSGVEQGQSIYLRSISMNGTTNVIITNITGYANVAYSNNVSSFTNDTKPIGAIDVRYTNLCYCIDYNTWWGWHDMENVSGIIFPANYYPLDSSTVQSKYIQYILKAGPGVVAPALYYLESTDTWAYFYDQPFYGTANYLHEIVMTIQLPVLEFVTVKRKFISKLSISMESIDPAESDSYIYVMYTKDDNTSTHGGQVRQIQANNAAKRYYITRLGSMRKVQFCIVSKSNFAWKVKALELELTQGTH